MLTQTRVHQYGATSNDGHTMADCMPVRWQPSLPATGRGRVPADDPFTGVELGLGKRLASRDRLRNNRSTA